MNAAKTVWCHDLVPNYAHCETCHEDANLYPVDYPLLDVDLKDARQALVCCEAYCYLKEEQQLVAPL